MRAREVAPEHGMGRLAGLAKSTLAGKVLVALRRQRRAPLVAARAWRARRGDPPAPRAAGRRRVRTVYVIPVGPGELERLLDTVASITVYEGDDAAVLVADDATVDCRPAALRGRAPNLDAVTSPWPTGGPPRLWPPLQRAFVAALDFYDFDVLVKLDTDALVTGALGVAAAREFAAHPEAGVLGTTGRRSDGAPLDASYGTWVLEQELRWTPSLRRLLAAAGADPARPAWIHGGVYALSRPALEASRASGWLEWHQPWWSILPEDLVISLVVAAGGHRVRSWGAPDEPTVSGSHSLPYPKERVLVDGKLAVHSLKRGSDGETEAELREYFRAARAGYASPSASR